jgi:hypothetical protein
MKNAYEVRGDVTVLYLKNRYKEVTESFIDTKDLEILEKLNVTWYSAAKQNKKLKYVHGNFRTENGRRKVCLHRYLMSEPVGIVDHINRNTFDNRRCNLRVVSSVENSQNRSIDPRNKSGVRGICWHKQKKKWYARFKFNNKIVFLKMYTDIDEAKNEIEKIREEYIGYLTEKPS